MKMIDSLIKMRPWLTGALAAVILTACSGGRDAILGSPNIAVAPAVTATTPIAKTPMVSGVPVNAAVTASFNKAMNAATINAASFTLACPASTPITGTVTFVASSRTATFSHAANFPASTTCTATMTTAAKDTVGLALTTAFVWQFVTAATPDTTAPTVIATGALDGATDLPVNRSSTATFSETMDSATLASPANTFTVKEFVSGNPVAGSVSYSGATATFVPASNLQSLTKYTSTITTVAKDLAGNAMGANYIWSWTTAGAADTTAPTVTVLNPLDLATGVCVNKTINVTFSEAMDAPTVTTLTFTLTPTAAPGVPVVASVTYDPLTNIASLNPTADLIASTPYTATVVGGAGGAKDLAGNALAVNKVWSFTTGTSSCAAAPALGAAAPFGSSGGVTGATNTGISSVITGDMSSTTTVASGVTGFHDSATPAPDVYTETASNIGLVTGRIYTCTVSTTGPTAGGVNAASCAIATNALADAQTAYNTLRDTPGGVDPSGAGGELGGLTLGPGVYKTATSFMVGSGDLTLDGQGDANAVWIFQMGSTLTIGDTVTPRNIILKPGSGAQAKNVYWQVGSSATLNGIVGGGTIEGTIIAAVKVTISTVGVAAVTTLNGRALGLTAQTVINNTVIKVPAL